MHSYFEIKICETHFKENLYFCAMNGLRKLLLPFSLVYGSILALRNLFYDKGWFKSKSYAFGFGFEFRLPNSTRPANLIPLGLGAIASFK